MAAWCWSDFEEIAHFEEMPFVQGQSRSLSNMVGGAKSHLESNPLTLQRFSEGSNIPCVHQNPENPHSARTVFECLLRRYRSAVDCCMGRGSGCSRPGSGISSLGGGGH